MYLPPVLEDRGLTPAHGEKSVGVRSIMCRDDTRSVRRPSDRDVN